MIDACLVDSDGVYRPQGPYTVDFFSRAPGFARGTGRRWISHSALVNGPALLPFLAPAVAVAHALKPALGAARVVDALGVTVYLAGSAPGREVPTGFKLPDIAGVLRDHFRDVPAAAAPHGSAIVAALFFVGGDERLTDYGAGGVRTIEESALALARV